jgi:hypothetical protein
MFFVVTGRDCSATQYNLGFSLIVLKEYLFHKMD